MNRVSSLKFDFGKINPAKKVKELKRAIVVYLEYSRGLLQQFACLYTSLKFINCSHDTDLVVFGTKQTLDLIPDDCIKVELNPLEGIWQTYRFMNSISCVGSKQAEFLNNYDYLLRTDLDVFLTPAWNSFFPTDYTVGRGAYCNNEEVRGNIKRIANKFNLRHQGVHNIGSTHYGTPSLVREVCKQSVDIAYYLLTEEFKDDYGAWPGWYGGVSSMYSTEIAVNHLVDEINVRPDMLDFDSTSTSSIHDHPHIHCWHTDHLFSKFQYGAGKYDHMLPSFNSNEVRQYCLTIGLEAKKRLPRLFI